MALDDLKLDELKLLKKATEQGLDSLSVGELKKLRAVQASAVKGIPSEQQIQAALKGGEADVLSLNERAALGLIDPKYAREYVEGLVPGSKVIDAAGTLVISTDGGETYQRVGGGGFAGDIAEGASRVAPFVGAIGAGVGGFAVGGPAGAIAGSAVSAAAFQAIRETIEAGEELNEQKIQERVSDILVEGGVDTALGVATLGLSKMVGGYLKSPAGKKLIDTAKRKGAGAVKEIAVKAKKLGVLTDEVNVNRGKVAEGAVLDDFMPSISNRGGEQAGNRFQRILQDKVDADDAVIDGLWKQSEQAFDASIKKFTTRVDAIKAQIKAANPGIGEKQARAMARKQIQAGGDEFLINLQPQFQKFMSDVMEAGSQTGAGVGRETLGQVTGSLRDARQAAFGELEKSLRAAGLKNLSFKAMTPKELFTLRKMLGSQIGKASNEGNKFLAKALTDFKGVIDTRLAAGDIPGAEQAKLAIKKQAQSYAQFPQRLREGFLQKPSKGVKLDISPDKAFDKVFKLDSNDRKLVGNIIQKSGQAKELALDTQAKFFKGSAKAQPDIPSGIPKGLRPEVRDPSRAGVEGFIKQGGKSDPGVLDNIVEAGKRSGRSRQSVNAPTVLKNMGVTPVEGPGGKLISIEAPAFNDLFGRPLAQKTIKPFLRLEKAQQVAQVPNTQRGFFEGLAQSIPDAIQTGFDKTIAPGFRAGGTFLEEAGSQAGEALGKGALGAAKVVADPRVVAAPAATRAAAEGITSFSQTRRPQTDEELQKRLQLGGLLGSF